MILFLTDGAALAAALALAPLAQAGESTGDPFLFTADPLAMTLVAGQPARTRFRTQRPSARR